MNDTPDVFGVVLQYTDIESGEEKTFQMVIVTRDLARAMDDAINRTNAGMCKILRVDNLMFDIVFIDPDILAPEAPAPGGLYRQKRDSA